MQGYSARSFCTFIPVRALDVATASGLAFCCGQILKASANRPQDAQDGEVAGLGYCAGLDLPHGRYRYPCVGGHLLLGLSGMLAEFP
jgi:hypothetical protein